MDKRAVFTIAGVVAVALVSGLVLLRIYTGAGSAESFGLPGIFVVSMLSHATMVARDIFMPLFLALTPYYNPVILGASAGLGGAIGDLVPYVLGLGVAETVQGKGGKAEGLVDKWIRKYGLWAVLVVAVTPLPDLPVLMLVGTRKLPFYKLVAIEAVGKTALYSFGASVGGAIFGLLIGSVGGTVANVGMVVASIVFSIVLTWPPSRDRLFRLLDSIIPGRD